MKAKWILLPVLGLALCGGGYILVALAITSIYFPDPKPLPPSELTTETRAHFENLARLRFPKDAELRYGFQFGDHGESANFKLRMSPGSLEELIQQVPFQGRTWKKLEGKSADGFDDQFGWSEWKPSQVTQGRTTDYGAGYDAYVLIDDRSSEVKDVYFRCYFP